MADLVPTDPRFDEQRALVSALVERAGTVTVTDAASNTEAARLLSLVKGHAKELTEHRFSMTRPLDNAKAQIIELFRPVLQDLTDAEQHIKGAMLDFDRAERQRIAAERAAAEAERRRLEEEAMQALDEGRIEEAAAAAADSMAVVAPAQAPVRARGTSVGELWRGEVTDLEALVKAIAAGAAPLSLVQADQSAINAFAKATKQEGEALPGVRFWRESSLSARAAAIR